MIQEAEGAASEKWDQSTMGLNVPRFVVVRNIRNNLRRQLPQLANYSENPQRIAIVAGGWSLKDTFAELRELHMEGVGLVAVNGSARWLMERNIKPAVHVVLDARPENIEFVRESIPGCQYFFASQVDGSLIEHCEGRNVTLFHAVGDGDGPEESRLDLFYNGHHPLADGERRHWVRVPPCATVGVTSILLMRLLGFRHQHMFGLDSCIAPDSGEGKPVHHAYDQALNDGDGYATFEICGKQFICSTWQAAQIESFKKMLLLNGEFLDLTVHGDGILAHMLKVGPEIAEAEMKGGHVDGCSSL